MGAGVIERRSASLVAWTLAINVVLVLGGVAVWLSSESQLVLAHTADSLLDLAAGAALLVSVRIARQPRDSDHPFGHGRAEPIAALVTAVLSGVLCFEVLRSAGGALVRGHEARLDLAVAGLLVAKLGIKVLLLALFATRARRSTSAALQATRFDTRNDVLSCGGSLVGWWLARSGFGWADAALALPVALYIGWNGFRLARENLRFLMGEAPPPAVQAELHALAAAVPGVLEVVSLRAQHLGTELHVEAAVRVSENESLTRGHDIGVEVQLAVQSHPLVAEAFVHVDTRAGREHE